MTVDLKVSQLMMLKRLYAALEEKNENWKLRQANNGFDEIGERVLQMSLNDQVLLGDMIIELAKRLYEVSE